MAWTNVNRLAREIEEASAVAKNLYNKHQAPQMYGTPSLAARTASWNKYMAAHKKTRNLIEKLKTLNQGALQVQLAKIENRRKALNKNLNKAVEGYGFGERNLIQNVFRNYSHWNTKSPKNDKDVGNVANTKTWTPKLRALKLKILSNKIKNLPTNTIYREYTKKIAPIAIQQARLKINEKALKNAVNLRKRYLGPEKLARNKFRSIVAQKVLPPIVQNINYAPYGRKTLNAMQRFPGYKAPNLKNYARARREANRLQRELENLRRALKRKRNNNNRRN